LEVRKRSHLVKRFILSREKEKGTEKWKRAKRAREQGLKRGRA
jgi:hypothetical protein